LTEADATARLEGGVAGGAQQRLRFHDFGFQRLTNGRCRAKVQLAWTDGRLFQGESEGMTNQTGELRCSALAAVHALERVTEPGMQFELLGVKAVRAFDATVIIVSLSVREAGGARRLVGSFLTDADPPRGAALAVLNATNRIMGNYFTTR
jgi:hypothetical protein